MARPDRVTKTATEPAQNPIGLEIAKTHAKISGDTEDDVLRVYLDAALTWAEEFSNRPIRAQEFLVVRDRFPISAWWLPLGRIQSIVKVEYIDSAGATLEWTASPLPYQVDLDTDWRPRLAPTPSENWPSVGDSYLGAARVTVNAGWTNATIPYTVQQAILMKFASYDAVRAPGDADPSVIVMAAKDLLSSWMLPPWG